MAAENIPVIKRSLLSWVWPGNGKLQLLAVLVISITVGARLLPMEMQKRIINQAIALRDLDLLLVYCAFYLGAVILATGLKFVLNTIQTAISQRVLARMRQELYHHLLTLPLSFFRKTQPGMVVSSLVTELVPAGDLAGMALTVPLINIGTVLAFGVYLFYLNWILAIITLSISPLVLFLLPVLQKKSNKANRQRLDLTRLMSNRITDTITGIHEVHGHGSFHIENKKYDVIVEKLRKVRIVWTLYNNLVKVASNFFTGLGPFLVFLIGGYMAMKGQLALGALVAFVSAQDRLYDPWKELIDFYQIYQDAVVRYKKTMEYFDAWPEFILEDADRPIGELDGGVEVKNLSFETEDGISLISGLNFTLNPGEHMALVGFSGSGKSTLAQCVGQLYKYTGGQVTIGGREVAEMSKAEMVHNMGYVSQSPFIFAGTIEENLLYSFAADRARHARGPDAMPTLDDIIGVLQQTGVFVDVLRFGLNAIMDKEKDKELIANLIKVRASFLEDFGQEMAPYIEFFQEDHFLNHSSIADNLIFGAPNRDDFSGPKLGQNDYFLKFLDEADLTRPLLSLGSQLARQTVDILGNLVPDKAFFEHSPVGPDELDNFKELVERLKKKKLHEISAADHASLLDLALRFTPGRHKMVGLPDMLKGLILEGRALFKERISEADPGAITFFQKSDYIYTETILNNIIFGRTKTGKIEVQEKINQSIIRLLIEEDYLEAIVKIGMQFDVGSKGDNLSGGQRQKLAIARAFLKNPKLLILDEATSALDNKSQGRIQNQLETRWKGKTTVIAVVHRLDITKSYDKIAVMKAGKIVEIGSYPELIAMKGIYHELVQGKK